jgi:predicted phage-related endonuclease
MAALIGNERLIIKRVEKDEELCQMMIEKEKEFWEENVLKNIPPEVDGSSDTEEILNSLYPSANNESIELSPNADQVIKELQDLKAKAKELDSEITERENILKQMLGENEAGRASNHWVFWKNFTSKRFDTTRFKNDNPDLYKAYTKESEYRKFTIKEVK